MYGNKLIKLIFMFFHSFWSYHAETEHKTRCGVNAHYGKKNQIYPFETENVFW